MFGQYIFPFAHLRTIQLKYCRMDFIGNLRIILIWSIKYFLKKLDFNQTFILVINK